MEGEGNGQFEEIKNQFPSDHTDEWKDKSGAIIKRKNRIESLQTTTYENIHFETALYREDVKISYLIIQEVQILEEGFIH